MRIAGNLSLVGVLCGFSVFALASIADVDPINAASDPVKQSARSETSSSAVNLKVKKVDGNSNSASSPDDLSKEKRKAKVLKARRQVVLDFLDQYFPELKTSLLNSEKKSPGKFRSAVSRLSKDIIRLRNIEQNQPAKFELMVEQWKLKTQIEITIAKYAKKESGDQLDERLNPLVEQMLDIRKSIFVLDRESTVKRLSSIDKKLHYLENSRDRAIQNNLRLFRKSADKIRSKQKGKSKQRQSGKTEAATDILTAEENP